MSQGSQWRELSHFRRGHGTAHVLPQVLRQELGDWQNGSRKISFQLRGVINNLDEGLCAVSGGRTGPCAGEGIGKVLGEALCLPGLEPVPSAEGAASVVMP